jgi:hypothetical protein
MPKSQEDGLWVVEQNFVAGARSAVHATPEVLRLLRLRTNVVVPS